MIAKQEHNLICDFAETYHVFDYKALPVRTAATLAAGLPANSRVKMALAGQKVDNETLLQAIIADRLGLLVWAQTEDGRRNRNRPKSIYDALTREREEIIFRTPEEFMAARARYIGE